ncbi:MAG: accessory factor UbiK family protein [Gammaproteobacteria bacterium]|nr:accessory factor UbiK family protein [Gammaproteobacteria bacterium]
MIDTNTLNDLTEKLSRLLPADLGILKKDLEKNIRAVLHSTFQKLDLVTREEFDVQSELLIRTREKLEALEKQLTRLEQARRKSK